MRETPDLSKQFITEWVTVMLAGGLWCFPFDYRYLKVSLAILLIMLFSLIAMYRELFPGDMSAFPEASTKYWLGRLFISIQLAWVSVATIVTTAMVLTDLGWDQHAHGAVGASIIVQIIAALLALLALWQRNDIVFAAVFVWAFFAIRDRQDERLVNGTATALAALLTCAVLGSLCSALFMGPRGFVQLD